VQDDIFAALFSFDPLFKGKCVEFDSEIPNQGGVINFGCFVLCLFVVACPALGVFLEGKADVCSGAYLVCKWEYERTAFYRIVAALLTCYTVAIIAYGVYSADATIPVDVKVKLLTTFLNWHSPNVVLLLVSAVSLARTQSRLPNFEYHDKRFRVLRFRRSWNDIFCQSNSDFARQLEQASMRAVCGAFGDLDSMLLDPQDAESVMEICALQTTRAVEEESELDEASPMTRRFRATQNISSVS